MVAKLEFIAILFQKSLVFGKLNVSHHNFIHGNVFKPQSPFSSFSRVAVLKYVIICSMQPFYFDFILQNFFNLTNLRPIRSFFFVNGYKASLETPFSLVFIFISSLRGNFCTFFTLLYLPRYTYKKVYSIRLIKLICY